MSISDIMYRSDGFSRITARTIEGKTLVTPTFFPAISSFGIKHRVDSLLDLLVDYSYPRLLISAYDIDLLESSKKRKMTSRINDYKKQSFVFIDSGMFESWWYKDSKWSFNQYKSTLENVGFDFYSSLDIYPSIETRIDGYVNTIYKSIKSSRSISDSHGFVAIFHGTTPTELVSVIEKTIQEVTELSNIIAIPERDCGVNIFDKASTILKIREILNIHDEGLLLHILGCGHPKSLALFSFCGVDMFDSLDWITKIINPENFDFTETSYLDLINCDCKFCKDSEMIYIERVLLHNLLFYQNYMKSIRKSIHENNFLLKLNNLIGSNFVKQILDGVLHKF